ncbi:MAG: hypothetical protein FWE11_03295 [Defluviitaleaceae bacterium]|nr:hypothetical protein [Defluviitaleaceae bacterium]
MKKNSILIELTPLLDVILIMLFFILVQSEGRMGTFYDEVREAFEAEIAIFEADMEAFKAEHAVEMEQLRATRDDYEALQLGLYEDTGIILISIVADPADADNRWVLVEADSHISRVDLSWNQVAREAATLELNTILASKIQDIDSTVVVVAFRFDSGNIFIADYRLVSGVIHIQRQFNQLVVAELDIRI